MTSGNLQRGTKRNARCNERQVASHTPEARLPVADFFPAFKDGDDGMEANITHIGQAVDLLRAWVISLAVEPQTSTEREQLIGWYDTLDEMRQTLLSSDGGDGDIRISPNEAGQGELT